MELEPSSPWSPRGKVRVCVPSSDLWLEPSAGKCRIMCRGKKGTNQEPLRERGLLGRTELDILFAGRQFMYL